MYYHIYIYIKTRKKGENNININNIWTSSQYGGIGRHCASSHQKKDSNKFKNGKKPELTENQTVWKSNNQGVKEETFIQTGRRGRDGKLVW